VSRRYPVQPLLDATGLTLNGFIRTHMPSVNGAAYRKARDEGLTADQADRWAVAAGLHPFLVWPDMADHQIEAAEAAEEERRRRYNARKAAAERARYHRDPRRRQQALENAKRYVDENRDYVNAQRRRRWHARKDSAA